MTPNYFQIDDGLLDDLKSHNARCLSHIHNFSRGLKSAITKENTNLAIKYIEHHVKLSGTAALRSTSGGVETPRGNLDDIHIPPVSGIEGNVCLLMIYEPCSSITHIL
jgi:hypothetical protein